VDDLWATKSEDVGLIARAISFHDFQPMWSWSTNVTDGQTDGQTDRQTTCDSKTALCTVVHRVVIILKRIEILKYHCMCSSIWQLMIIDLHMNLPHT